MKEYKPSDYLRARRPERYSDSIVIEEPQITQDIIEYHLETLTSRSQEKEFEHFARRLAEKELCPNLLPQTGPTGGGDSKVDSETYPVAEEISIRWYQGNAGATSRWAFAMSAKKEWRGKAKSDVKKIVLTKRGYELIYFITNQFVSDKKRAEVEDSLREEFKVDVRILDRTWIVERIVNHDHFELAAQTLSIEGLRIKPRKRVGLADIRREEELERLDQEIKDTDRYLGAEYQLAEDCLQSAVIASELERNRHEVDGRFQAALRVAEKVDDQRQILRILYRQAWVSCFVYDDVLELSKLYERIESLGLSSEYADDIELVNNLWNTLMGSVQFGNINDKKAELYERGERLRKKLEELSEDSSRPNNALHARTMLCFHKLALIHMEQKDTSCCDEIFEELVSVFQESKGLGQYPFVSYKDIVFEFGQFFTDSDSYEHLFDIVLSIQEERQSEGETAGILTKRGIQKLQNNNVYDAIRLFGNAKEKLVKEEYKDELIRCLVASAGAYRSAGLLWAARADLLAALATCIREFDDTGFMHHLALLAAKELAWIELKIGRIPNIIFILGLLNFIANSLQIDEEDQERYWEYLQHFDAVFSMLILKSKIVQLEKMLKLPYVLDQLNLVCSEGALLFSIGCIDELKKGVWFSEQESDRDIDEFYQKICDQPANEDLPAIPELYLDKTIKLKSNVLGINLVAHVDANQKSLLIAESLLAALESFLSTSLCNGILPHKENVDIAIRESEEITDDLKLKLIVDSDWEVEVVHKGNFSLSSAELMQSYREFIKKFIMDLLPKISIVNDEGEHIVQLIEKENVFGRTLIFSDVMTLSEHVFGSLDWLDVQALSDSVDEIPYTLRRTVEWKPEKPQQSAKKESLKAGKGPIPDEVKNSANLKHNERKVLSLIDIDTWNRAKWNGSFFMIYDEGVFPPCMGLLFTEEESAKKIFTDWLDRLGKHDDKSELRICIVTDVDKNNPAHYRIHIGTDINSYERSGAGGQFVMLSRIQTMTPDSSKNLDLFLQTYEKYGCYCLMPAIYQGDGIQPKVLKEIFLMKKKLVIKPAWQIGEHDEDFVVLHAEDTPIIPDDETAPPVIAALNRLKKGDANRA